MMEINVEHRFECCQCHELVVDTFSLREGDEIPRPNIPRGWEKLRGLLFCPLHEIAFEIHDAPKRAR